MNSPDRLFLFCPNAPEKWLKSCAKALAAEKIERIGPLGHRLLGVRTDGDIASALKSGAPAKFDWVLVPGDRRIGDYRLLVLDMDGTLIKNECIDELAGLLPNPGPIREMTSAAMRGTMPVEESLRKRVAALGGLQQNSIKRVLDNKISIRPGAERLMRMARTAGWQIILLTGGFSQFAQPVAKRLGIQHVLCNQLDIANGKLAGTFTGVLVDGPSKAQLVAALADKMGIAPKQVVALGDGANDLETLSAAGLSIGIEPKPLIAEIVDAQLWHTPLDAVWHIAGGN